MSVFQRIDPGHPLAQAARETNDYAAEHGLEETLAWLGMDATTDDLAYLGEQRALRAIAAASVGISIGDSDESPDVAAKVVAAIVETPLWRDMRGLLVGCYMDAFAIGWRAHEIASSDGASEEPTA